MRWRRQRRTISIDVHNNRQLGYIALFTETKQLMMTLGLFSSEPDSIPASTSWYLADLGEARGKQELFTKQAPQKLKVLYETLEESSAGWHEGRHDPWPYINYLLYTLKTAYKEFERRVGEVKSPRGAKTGIIVEAITRWVEAFRVSDLQRECPGVSLDLIRKVLKDLQAVREVECLGRGQNAQWRRTSKRIR